MLSNKTRMAFMHTFLTLKLGYLPFAFMFAFAKVLNYACKNSRVDMLNVLLFGVHDGIHILMQWSLCIPTSFKCYK
jgi:hypothetical protein